ncbi:MAG: threonylcarbamoyl-AMP synthase, partial [Lachnospiraceae bacterium]|nr:threonylcarbamoyl-AMP synthase [Lachnospiraceae bacterium]
ALRSEAAKKIYAAKGRPSDNPLIVHIAKAEALYEIAEEVSDRAERLMKAFWPGPLTMIFKKSEKVPFSTTGGLATVAVRMPVHPVAMALIKSSGVFIAAPSANTSGRPSPTKAEHVIEDLSGKIDMIIDGGPVGIGLESTILDMTEAIPVILRPGYITKEMLEDVIGEVTVDPALLKKPDERTVAKAPGMKYRHYAPKGRMFLVEGESGAVIQKIDEIMAAHREKGEKAAVIATEESKGLYHTDQVYSIGSRKSEGSIAAGLYDILRKMDHIGAEYIYAESFGEDKLGAAIMNRMRKAAGYQKIYAGRDDEERR